MIFDFKKGVLLAYFEYKNTSIKLVIINNGTLELGGS